MMHRSPEDKVELERITGHRPQPVCAGPDVGAACDVTEHAEGSVKGIKEDIRLLSNYQLELCGMITGWHSRHKTTGTPERPGSIQLISTEPYLTRGVQEGESIEKAFTHTKTGAQHRTQRPRSRPQRSSPASIRPLPQPAEKGAANHPPGEERFFSIP
ncbi:hypothetical protein L3476_14235 [Paenibacillus thiaminolyticus]|uniref:hypothetical protein n=1 Tax=Paenibacillus thiaminolyticus TaxID=49283 RepID=UPI00235067B7|nr:hypothetical protein [Paenibacillus thiaminolyticus]WCR30179.1 hypothetical protein L3476_14235 [Paenibacillus thiaminolyticus]